MKSMFKSIIIIASVVSLMFVAIGCENEGTAEKAGKQVDQTIDSIKKKIDDAKD